MTSLQTFYAEKKYSCITEEFPDKTRFPLYYEANKKEYIIDEGEMLFIPAGWWHFVFSEEVNPDSKINYAMNFWYEEPVDWKEGITDPEYMPKLEKHDILSKDPSDFLKDYDLAIHRSKTKYFPPIHLKHIHPKLDVEYMKYVDFKHTRNPEYYILQNKCTEIEKYAPVFERPINMTSIWVNFGSIYSLPHYDMKDNWLCQLQGKKRVLLFPPEDRDKLYPINSLSLDLVQEIGNKLMKDRFIMIKRLCVDGKLCESILNLLPMETFTHSVFLDSYKKYSNEYIKLLDSERCAFPDIQSVETFNIKDVRGSMYEEPQLEVPYMFLWFLTKGSLTISKYEFQVYPGDLYIFPSLFTYPWLVKNCVFMYPSFRLPTQDKSS